MTGRKRRGRARAHVLLGAALALAAAVRAGAADMPEVERGEYVLRAAGCVSCHTAADGEFLAGGRPIETPFGVFYAPNITPHPEEGIGNWREADLASALTRGRGPGGIHYYPAFPYTSYTGMQREDTAALYAYLASVPPVARANREHDLPWYLRLRFAARVWKLLFFDPRPFEPDPERSQAWNRGAYLVTALAHCGECHTPRDPFGVRREEMRLAGNPSGPEGKPVPNITPDPETGIGNWTRLELLDYLELGIEPDGDVAGGAMAEVIDDGLSHLTREDLEAIVTHVLSLPPIRHVVDGPDTGE